MEDLPQSAVDSIDMGIRPEQPPGPLRRAVKSLFAFFVRALRRVRGGFSKDGLFLFSAHYWAAHNLLPAVIIFQLALTCFAYPVEKGLFPNPGWLALWAFVVAAAVTVFYGAWLNYFILRRLKRAVHRIGNEDGTQPIKNFAWELQRARWYVFLGGALTWLFWISVFVAGARHFGWLKDYPVDDGPLALNWQRFAVLSFLAGLYMNFVSLVQIGHYRKAVQLLGLEGDKGTVSPSTWFARNATPSRLFIPVVIGVFLLHRAVGDHEPWWLPVVSFVCIGAVILYAIAVLEGSWIYWPQTEFIVRLARGERIPLQSFSLMQRYIGLLLSINPESKFSLDERSPGLEADPFIASVRARLYEWLRTLALEGNADVALDILPWANRRIDTLLRARAARPGPHPTIKKIVKQAMELVETRQRSAAHSIELVPVLPSGDGEDGEASADDSVYQRHIKLGQRHLLAKALAELLENALTAASQAASTRGGGEDSPVLLEVALAAVGRAETPRHPGYPGVEFRVHCSGDECPEEWSRFVNDHGAQGESVRPGFWPKPHLEDGKVQGLGLGLVFAAEAARLTGGKLEVLSDNEVRRRRGSTVVLGIPFEQPVRRSAFRPAPPVVQEDVADFATISPALRRAVGFEIGRVSRLFDGLLTSGSDETALARLKEHEGHMRSSSRALEMLNEVVAGELSSLRELLNRTAVRLNLRWEHTEEEVSSGAQARLPEPRDLNALRVHLALSEIVLNARLENPAPTRWHFEMEVKGATAVIVLRHDGRTFSKEDLEYLHSARRGTGGAALVNRLISTIGSDDAVASVSYRNEVHQRESRPTVILEIPLEPEVRSTRAGRAEDAEQTD